MMHRTNRPFLFGLLAATAATAWLPSQCATGFAPGDPVAGTNGEVTAVQEWDPDGNGPQAARIIVAGEFDWIAGIQAASIAALDPATGEWSAMAGGLDRPGAPARVRALDVMPSGELVAAGNFESAGGATANGVATWDGQSWTRLGADTPTLDIAIMSNGDLVASPQAFNGSLRRWNGSTWTAFGGTIDGAVFALEPLANGDLLIGGSFASTGGAFLNNIARWDGSNWFGVGAGLWTLTIYDIAVLASGDIVAAGTGAGLAGTNITRFDGTNWLPMGGGLNSLVATLLPLANGELIAGGYFGTQGVGSPNGIARWNGTAWTNVGGGLDSGGNILSLAQTASGDLLAGGSFASIGGTAANSVARFDGSIWQPLKSGTDREAFCTTAADGDNFYVGGDFTTIGGVAANRIAHWNGSSWMALGGGCNGRVSEILRMPNGDIIAGGAFDMAGGVSVNNIARWDGSNWSALGNGVQFGFGDTKVEAMALLPDGSIAVGGEFTVAGSVAARNLAVWDGTSWAPMGSGSFSPVQSLLPQPNGGILAAGSWLVPSNSSLRIWDGTNWIPFAPVGGIARIDQLVQLPGGEILACGSFNSVGTTSARSVARWDGTTWNAYGAGISNPVYGAEVLPNGDVLAVGGILSSGGNTSFGVARWDGTSWSPIGNGIRDGIAQGVAALANGDVIIVGSFESADGQSAASVARLSTSCPAQATSFGAGCGGSGGSNELTATTLPWLDTSYELRATGMPSNGIVVGIRGLATTQQPLAQLLPQGQPGCELLVRPDLLDLYLPASGETRASFPIPNNPALVGQVLHHQMVPFALQANGSIAAVTATNGLTMTIGVF